MKAIAVFPGKPNSVHLADLPNPALTIMANALRVGDHLRERLG